ncbi:GNAT family N-acetyltransferase [Ruminococcaceae bacterium OttesenSCG-928-L11]|nr:GNAT family N-acetyltransferase [Ruminococcaceae bacterium OttesenSCG-928-L11]
MKYRFAMPSDLPALQTLWQECFGDSPDYTTFLFARLIRPERALVAVEGGIPRAMAFFTPFRLSGGGEQGAYLFGVGTALSHRGQGLSTALLAYADSALAEQGYALAVLVPASESLFAFYGKRGYSPFARICRHTAPVTAADAPQLALTSASLPELAPARRAFFASLGDCVLWDEETLAYIQAECLRFGGEVLGFSVEGSSGYAVCYRGDGAVAVKELVCPPSAFGRVAAALSHRYGDLAISYTLHSVFSTETTQTDLPYALGKWYDTIVQAGTGLPYIGFTLD